MPALALEAYKTILLLGPFANLINRDFTQHPLRYVAPVEEYRPSFYRICPRAEDITCCDDCDA